ncbi:MULTISPECIES: RHS repeat-associated core domain-containing protein [Methylosinus]|uniref:RHS repeat-associated core domain-containing protein n=1 Tax=Methylosinus trichosporium (strain ATCC 35070 / NCIMB 11131 / UNIQEM 75 / OB3b) TaxID=595536 RepID=A0A2D2D1D1_METT3|nr:MULTISPECIES: RHS repeat-associated core domain-containing protein [Methylosinus]ATQ68803.1 RHS repeat-associated core domain-containing protein [Methylosinus trichosporium OB3b]OBS51487.1 hypothetical protein A8B73_15985 [Methylosinus sp. 3S-1]
MAREASGAPHEIVNAANARVWFWDHDPFGNGTPTAAAGFSHDLRFPGQIYDSETRLHNNGFRDYSPTHGRYVESDPIGLAGGINTYAYAGNNPVNAIDPLGLDPESKDDAEALPKIDIAGQPPTPKPKVSGTASPPWLQCFAACVSDHYDLGGIATRAGLLAGSAPIPKSMLGLPVVGKASPNTNPISYLGFLLGESEPRLPYRVLGTTRVFGIMGRAVPFVGVGFAAYDVISIGICTAGCGGFAGEGR